MKLLRILNIASAAMFAAASVHASVSVEIAGGYLKDQGNTRIANGSGLLVLVASTSDTEFTPLTSSSSLVVGTSVSTGSDDRVIYKSVIGGDGNLNGVEDAGEYRQVGTIIYDSTVAAGNAIKMYWFPTLSLSATEVGTGTRFAAYRSTIGSAETQDSDGSLPWFLPADGVSGYSLLFLTSDAGSLINTATSGVEYGQTVASENHAPVATDDTFNVAGKSVLDLVANDTDPDGDTLTVISVTEAAQGIVSLSDAGVVTYTPGASLTGSDTFNYTVSDGNGGTATASVAILGYSTLQGRFSASISLDGVSAGTVSAKLTSSGLVTGKLLLNGKTYVLRGSTDSSGTFTQTLKPAGTTVTLTFSTDANGYATVSGSIVSAAATYAVTSTPALAGGALATAPIGRYNCLFSGSTASNLPSGTGWCSIVLTKTGSLRGIGRLPDKTALAFSTALRVDGSAAIETAVYGAPVGSLNAALLFAASDTTDVSGTFTLVKPPRKLFQGLFPSGFTLTGSVTGERYQVPAVGSLSFTFATAAALADVSFVDGGLASSVSQAVSFDLNGKGTRIAPANIPLTLVVARNTGLAKGRFTPTDGNSTAFTAVTLPKSNIAAGVFAGSGQTGTATITPR